MPSNSNSPWTAAWWRERWTSDLPASLVVFLVALPLSMGIAIASGAPVAAGLVTGIVGGIVAGLLSGAPLQVSGPAAGLTVIVYQCIQEYGIEELGVVVLLAGLLQVLAAALRLGPWFRAVSPAVVQGMLAGIGVLIFCSQFHVMVDDKPKQNGLTNLVTIPQAIAKALPSFEVEKTPPLDRNVRSRLLAETGPLHLAQSEIREQVHHLLAGIGPTSAPPASHDGASAPDPTSTINPEEQIAAERLRELAPAQARLIGPLAELATLPGADLADVSLRDCRQALADLEAGAVHSARASQDRAADGLADLRDSAKSHCLAASIGVLTICVLLMWQAGIARRLKFIPAPLVAVLAATLVTALLDLPVLFVEVPDNLLEEVYFPSLAELRSVWQPGLLLVAVEVAVIASAETLLCATAVDQMHAGPRTRYDKELFAQGVGNMVCGLLSALPMTGVIVRSSANVQAGAKSRWSSVLHGVWILVFVAFFTFVLRMIPTASLAAILVYTGYKLINLKALANLWKYGRAEAGIHVATMVGIVATDLLTGVLVGLGLSVVKLLYTLTSLKVTLSHDPAQGRSTLVLAGSATFLKLPTLATILEQVPPGSELHVQLDRLSYIDHACLELLTNWQARHEATGGRLVMDWNSLAARFRGPRTDAAVRTFAEKRGPLTPDVPDDVPETAHR